MWRRTSVGDGGSGGRGAVGDPRCGRAQMEEMQQVGWHVKARAGRASA
jgi:hypothetical protein